MYQRIAHISLIVKDYDEAIEFYTNKLGFQLLEDTKMSAQKRWVVVSPNGGKECSLVLVKATSKEQSESIGKQAGGKVFLFLYTDDFWRDYEKMKAQNINFIKPPNELNHGTVAIFMDLYGNKWDLIQPRITEDI